MYTLNPGTTHYHESDRGRFPSPHEVRDAPADACVRDGDEDVAFRKRRRGLDEDTDYQPPGPRRVGVHFFVSAVSDRILFQTLRRYVPRGKPSHAYSPLLVGPDLKLENSEEDLRLVSSDLEDCPEVWIGELSDYVLETQKRQKQVEKWFESSILVGFPRTFFGSVSYTPAGTKHQDRSSDVTPLRLQVGKHSATPAYTAPLTTRGLFIKRTRQWL